MEGLEDEGELAEEAGEGERAGEGVVLVAEGRRAERGEGEEGEEGEGRTAMLTAWTTIATPTSCHNWHSLNWTQISVYTRIHTV